MIKNIITAFDHISQKYPNNFAYDYLGEQATYSELRKKADTLAAHLLKMDLPDKAPVMVYGGQTLDMVVAFLALVKSGHAYIPVDDHSSEDRLLMIQDVAQPPLVIAVDDLPVALENIDVLDKNQLQTIYQIKQPVATTNYVGPDDNFYIIFTSGTTGKPKGVQISHRNLLSFVNWQLADFYFPKGANVLAQAPYSFDLSVMGLYPTLVTGGTLKVLPKDVTENFKALFTTLPKMDLNIWISTPSLVEICLLSPDFNCENYPNLVTFLFCGEELSHKTAANLKKRFAKAHIYNTYGPTETTVAVTGVEITPEILARYDRLPIGYVKSDTDIWIDTTDVDGATADQKQGEIIISGPSVSKGYLNLPEKTHEVFQQSGAWPSYASGDLGYFNDAGLLFYRGRKDFQIKFNGYRIELEELNFFLKQQELVDQGAIVPRYNAGHKVTQLIALVVPRQKSSVDETALTEQIKGDLALHIMPYMMPQRFVFRTELPLSANGKVDIKSLIQEVNAGD
ncbi:D-alanine--poly(phosphoribitol) ligase subunit DltA [Lapidilactobacillus gannanensis]|uniref:D-alanine--D-alanyl carrier protein ligase n=1 Tax=Lapidilactobacillus gannanensis TaxID=2486002 RepID=A0ABW4BL64_9LACO|nr:D-alanine--poly(phosphoribitol) ligase subunit DltA [Lapidilactobacillus gannanensis]